jgi:hypothetical protein
MNVERWDGGSGDLNWSNPANWEGDTLPDINSRVVIDIPGDAVVSFSTIEDIIIASLTSNESLEIANRSLEIAAASTIAGRLIMTAGELRIGSSLSVAGQLQWARGDIHGPGMLNLNGGALLSGSFNKGLWGATVNNAGLFRIEGDGNLLGGNGATFNNNGTFELRTAGGQNVTYLGGGQSGNAVTTFNNNPGGTVLKSGDSAIGTLDLCFVEAGGTVVPNAKLVIADDCP